jgi:hypothetical protein
MDKGESKKKIKIADLYSIYIHLERSILGEESYQAWGRSKFQVGHWLDWVWLVFGMDVQLVCDWFNIVTKLSETSFGDLRIVHSD